jgi:hypothetical protein
MNNIPGFILDNSRCLKCGGIQTKATSDPKVVQALLDMLKHEVTDVNLTACACETPTLAPLARKDQYKGKTVCICGSGPSLKKSARRIRRGEFDHVWGCNDALIWLTQNGYNCTHGVGIDQSPDLYTECWKDPPDVRYILATSVDSKLPEYLRSHGRDNITFFHSFIGFDKEYELYGLLYDFTVLSGEGLNVVNRAIGVAEFMGYDKVYVAGADCAFGKRKENGKDVDTFHVHGDKVEGIVLRGKFDGQNWRTKPDMLVSAISLVGTQHRMGSRLELLGNVLPKALKYKDKEFLDSCIRWVTPEEKRQRESELAIARYAPNLDSEKIQQLLDGGSVKMEEVTHISLDMPAMVDGVAGVRSSVFEEAA